MRASSRGAALAALAALTAIPVSSHAAGLDAATCVQLHAAGQDAKESAKLVKARAAFVRCAVDQCPKVVRDDCAHLLTDVEADLPTLVFEARDENGQDTRAVRVTVDGSPLLDHLKATAIAVDPGRHVFEFSTPDGKKVQRRLTVLQGQKNRLVVVKFARPKAPPSHRALEHPELEGRAHAIPLGAYVLGGVGVAALASFGYFALRGRSKQSDLQDHCAPRCPGSEYDAMKRDYLVADISLGVAVVAGGLTTWLVLSHSSHSPRVGFSPVPAGGYLRYEARF